jgi:hypothetical protein
MHTEFLVHAADSLNVEVGVELALHGDQWASAVTIPFIADSGMVRAWSRGQRHPAELLHNSRGTGAVDGFFGHQGAAVLELGD